MKSEHVIGIDLSDTTLDIALVEFSGDIYEVQKTYHTNTPDGLVVNGRITDIAAVVSFISDACNQADILLQQSDSCAWVLPQCSTYTQIYTATDGTPSITVDAMIQSARTLAPFAASDIVLTHISDAGRDIVAVASAMAIESWQSCAGALFDGSHYFFLEGYAAQLGLSMPAEHGAYVLIDVGGRSTTATFVYDSVVQGMYTSPIAGIYMTQEIARVEGISIADAQDRKERYGISARSPLSEILNPIVDLLTDRLHNAIDFYEKKLGISFQSAVYVGGTMQMKGMRTALQKRIGLVELAVSGQDAVAPEALCAVGAARAVQHKKVHALFDHVVSKRKYHTSTDVPTNTSSSVDDSAVHQTSLHMRKYGSLMLLIALCAVCAAIWLFFLL